MFTQCHWRDQRHSVSDRSPTETGMLSDFGNRKERRTWELAPSAVLLLDVFPPESNDQRQALHHKDTIFGNEMPRRV